MADYAGVLADLKTKLAALDREREGLEAAIAAIERLPGLAGAASQQSTVGTRTVSPRAFTNMTMPQAITKALKCAGEPQAKSQIKETLRAGGRSGKNIGTHIYNTLHRLSKEDGPFRREPDGRWSLRAWPSAPADSAARTLNQATH
jgi:hypothetical protein